MASLESVLCDVIDEAIEKVDLLSRDAWIDGDKRRRLTTLKLALDEARANFHACDDNGPTPADIAGEVQHDIG
jgi:hypothetical protein